MSTSGSFTPAQAPECPYAPRMTRAAALALRTAGGLRENCVVVVTDAGTLGPGAVPAEVELNPVGPSAFGLTARIFSALDDSAWAGLWDIDLGAGGTFLEVRDNLGNVVRDPDGSVIAEFPWGNTDVTDNRVTEGTLTGWGVLPAGFVVRNNTLSRATVDLTGAVSGSFSDNVVTAATVNVPGTNAAPVIFADCQLSDQATITVNKPSQQFVMNGTRMRGGTVSATGPSPFSSTRDDLTNPNWTDAGGVAPTANWASNGVIGGGTINRAAGHDFAATFTNDTLYGTINIGAGARSVAITQTHYLTGTATVNGGQLIVGGSTFRSMVFTMSGTRGLVFSNCDVHGIQSFTQSRTGGTGTDGFLDCVLQNATISISGAADPGGGQTLMNRCTVLMSTVNFTDPVGVGTVVLQSTEVTGQSALNVQAGALLHDRCRFASGCLVNTGAFAAQGSVVEGMFTKTSTGTNINRRVDKSYDDWI